MILLKHITSIIFQTTPKLGANPTVLAHIIIAALNSGE